VDVLTEEHLTQDSVLEAVKTSRQPAAGSGPAWRDGWRRVFGAPALAFGIFALTLALAAPLAIAVGALLRTHLGRSAVAADVADGVNYDWWNEFLAQATGLGSTFTPGIVGFAATLDNLSSLADAQSEQTLVIGVLALYLTAWTFLAGGILDRYARQRRTRAHGFFAACGVYFFRFLRLAIVAALVYGCLFTYVHPWLFDDAYGWLTRDVAVERVAFAWRASLYAVFGALLVATNIVFDYAKVRAVVEDRRSMLSALGAALRFIRRRPGQVLGLYALNTLVFLLIVGVWAAIAPGAGGAGLSMWLAFAIGQLYLFARLLLKLQFLASQTALFQANLAHAAYTAAPVTVWPESPAAEAIGPRA
jgi:hypothetical protein